MGLISLWDRVPFKMLREAASVLLWGPEWGSGDYRLGFA